MLKALIPLQDRFGFTRNEVKVVAVLACALLVGLVIRWATPGPTPSVPPFDYTASDHTFTRRAARPVEPLQSPVRDRSSRTTTVSPYRLIDINGATKEELMMLPGIGPAYAERIIRSRADDGPFTSVDDLDRVRGIGKATIARLRPFIVVRPGAATRLTAP